MKNLEKWCEGKPPILVLVLKLVLPEIRETFETLQLIRQNRPGSWPEVTVPNDLWCKLYRKEKIIGRMSVSMFFGVSDPASIEQSFRGQGFSEKIKTLEGLIGDVNEFNSPMITNFKALANSENPKYVRTIFIIICIMEFMFRIQLPCLLHYGKRPMKLLRDARLGHLDALDDLIRLDKSITGDRLVKMHWHRIMTGNNPAQKKILLDAMAGEPRRTITVKRMKLMIGAVLQLLGDLVGYHLSKAELRFAFDAAAKDRNIGLIDVDLPTSDEAFDQAINRERRELLSSIGMTIDEWKGLSKQGVEV